MLRKGGFIGLFIILLLAILLVSGCYSYRKYDRYPKPRKNCHGCPSFTHDNFKAGVYFT